MTAFKIDGKIDVLAIVGWDNYIWDFYIGEICVALDTQTTAIKSLLENLH